jgi:hypothetical protein
VLLFFFVHYNLDSCVLLDFFIFVRDWVYTRQRLNNMIEWNPTTFTTASFAFLSDKLYQIPYMIRTRQINTKNDTSFLFFETLYSFFFLVVNNMQKNRKHSRQPPPPWAAIHIYQWRKRENEQEDMIDDYRRKAMKPCVIWIYEWTTTKTYNP